MYSYKEQLKIITLMHKRSITNLRIYCVFLYIQNNPNSTSKQIGEAIKINSTSLRAMLLALKQKGFIDSVDDDSDTTKNHLRRQLYFVSEEITKLINSESD